jgi:FkbM family methyltransferase
MMTAKSAVATALRTVVPRSARNWLRSPKRSVEWGVDHARFALGGAEHLEVRDGWVLHSHPVAARCAYMPLVDDSDQRAELDAFIDRCSPGMRLLDIGAHFGIFSFAALHYGGPDASAVAVDPSRTATGMLKLHAELNSVSSRLRVVEACAAAGEGRRGMLDTGVIGAGYFVGADVGRRAADLSDVRTVSIDTLCAELDFSPTHLKIDVEGDELDVLRGAVILLRGSRPALSLELHNAIIRATGEDPRNVIEFLAAVGYSCQDVSTGTIDSRSFERDVTRLVADHVR